MEINQLAALMEQFKQEGGDWDALSSRFNALSADTSPLGLRVWKSADKPRMEDFNENYQRLEEEILALRAELGKKVDIGAVTLMDIPYTGAFHNFKGMDSYYYKTHDNQVVVHLSAESDSILVNGQTVATLPVGYRPRAWMERSCIIHSPLLGDAMIGLHPDGSIKVRADNISTQKMLFFTATFAAQ